MKLLAMYSNKFSYSVASKKVADAEEINGESYYENVLMAFIQVEEKDEMDQNIAQLLIKHLKWVAGRNDTNRIFMHSFTHLSDSKASPEFTKKLFDLVEQRMARSEFEIYRAPFGYYLDIDMSSPGYPDSRTFKSF
jgi:hypothetical protein